MKKMHVPMKKSLVRKMSITNIIIFSLACFLSIGATILLNIQYHISRDSEMMNAYISNAISSIDNTLKDMGRVSLICFADDGIQSILKDQNTHSLRDQIKNQKYMEHLYRSLISIRADIKGIYIFDLNGIIFYNDMFQPSMRKDAGKDTFFDKVKYESERNTNISGCHMYFDTLPDSFRYNYIPDSKKEYSIYLVRPIRSFSPFEEIGYIALRTPIETMYEICDEYLESNVSYLLVDENNTVSCSSDSTMIGSDFRKYNVKFSKELEKTKGSFISEYNHEKSLICFQKSSYSNMTLITTKPLHIILGEMKILIMWCLGVVVICSFIVLCSISMMTRKNLRHIVDFSRDVREFDPADLSQRFEVGEMDEVGILKDSFNKMIERLNKAVILEYDTRVRLKEMEISEQKMAMLYLKQQINPHFLYNTLDSIRLRAALNKDNEVSEMLMKLVSFYRLSTRVDSQFVEVRQEVNMLDAYMSLMCYRYPELKYHANIEETTKRIEIPNFILQPLFENSLMHGLKDLGYVGNIWLNIFMETDLHILIMDDGVGMSEELMKKLNMYNEKVSRFKEKEETRKTEKHIGVLNVVSRLHLFYQDDCNVRYYKNNEEKTCVEIIIKQH